MRRKIDIVELGPSLSSMQYGAVQKLLEAGVAVVQSLRAGAAAELARCRTGQTVSLDGLFEESEDFDVLYEAGARQIAELPADESVVFGCIGSPRDNGFVQALSRTCDVVVSGGYDPLSDAMRRTSAFGAGLPCAAVEARSLEGAAIDSSQTLVVLGIDDRFTASQTKLVLTEYYPAAQCCWLLLGEELEETTVDDLDRRQDWGSGGTLVMPPLSLTQKERFTFVDLLAVMSRLRAPDGCPWDAEQTHDSLRPYLIEEAYEVSDAVSSGDMQALYDELGDVVLQVVFHAQIGREAGEFDIGDVTTAVCRKMIRRHPHVFGTVHVEGSDDVLRNWDQIKREEKGEQTYASSMEDIPAGMSALLRAVKIQKKAANVGFEWPCAQGALEKVREETDEFEAEMETGGRALEQEAGDLLFAAVNALRMKKIDPETALADACAKFVRRFSYVEQNAPRGLEDMTLDEMDTLWNEAKAKERETG